MVQAQAQADVNPIYISDVEYYASVLAQAEHCIRSLTPVATVFPTAKWVAAWTVDAASTAGMDAPAAPGKNTPANAPPVTAKP